MVRFSKALLCLPACALLVEPAVAARQGGLLRGAKKSLVHRLTQEATAPAKATEPGAVEAMKDKGEKDAAGVAPVVPADEAVPPVVPCRRSRWRSPPSATASFRA